MNNIKQTLTEEISKMNYLFGYKKGQVISEQTDAEWQGKYFCVTQLPGVQTQKNSDGSTRYETYIVNAAGNKEYTIYYNNGKKQKSDRTMVAYTCNDPEFANVRKSPTDQVVSGNQPPAQQPGQQPTTIRGRVEADIAKEKLGITWAQVKQRFGSSGQGTDNQLLWKAWKGGWRPGTEVPEQLQTATYKQNNARMEPIGMKPIQPGAVTASANSGSADNTQTQVSPLVQQNTDIKTPEQAKAAVDQAQEQAKIAKQQKKLTQEMCRVVGRAINPIMPLKQGVANQELCDTLRQCMKDGLLVRDNSAFDACKAFPEKPITAPAAPAAPAPTK
jgi:hypothetical protein